MELWTFSRSIKNIQTTTKEWYPQILQNKQNVHIILQQLCPPFPRGKKRGKNQMKHFSSQSPGPPFYRHASVCRTLGPSGFHSIEICCDMSVWPIHSLEIGAPFFRCSTSSPPGPLKNGATHPFHLIQTGIIYIYIFFLYTHIYF